MSSALFQITVVAVRREGAAASAEFRCVPLNTPDDRAVTRSFVIRMLGADAEMADAGPPLMVKAVVDAGLQSWPENELEALRSYAPVLDRLVTATRYVPGDDGSFVVHATFPDPRLVAGLKAGQAFDTYAHDAWWADPKNPLATDEERRSWEAEVRRVLAADARRDEAQLDAQAEPVMRWLAAVQEKSMIAIADGAEGRIAKEIAALIARAADPDEARAAVVEYLLDSDDVDEVFVDDHVLLRSLAPLLG